LLLWWKSGFVVQVVVQLKKQLRVNATAFGAANHIFKSPSRIQTPWAAPQRPTDYESNVFQNKKGLNFLVQTFEPPVGFKPHGRPRNDLLITSLMYFKTKKA
jgi:hypothetical protein